MLHRIRAGARRVRNAIAEMRELMRRSGEGAIELATLLHRHLDHHAIEDVAPGAAGGHSLGGAGAEADLVRVACLRGEPRRERIRRRGAPPWHVRASPNSGGHRPALVMSRGVLLVVLHGCVNVDEG